MTDDSDHEITRVLSAIRDDRAAAEELLPLVYQQLRELARARMRNEARQLTLQPTALVHEAYMRVVGNLDPGWNSRGHFFGAAALAMRRILVEQARRRQRLKRGGKAEDAPLEGVEPAIEAPGAELLAVNRAVDKLELQDARKARIVNLRYFVGMTVEETAEVLGVSVGTVEREWRFIRSWLRVELGGD